MHLFIQCSMLFFRRCFEPHCRRFFSNNLTQKPRLLIRSHRLVGYCYLYTSEKGEKTVNYLEHTTYNQVIFATDHRRQCLVVERYGCISAPF